MEYGVQLVSIAVIITIMINFFTNRRLSIFSTKLFTCFILLTFLNVVFEFMTLYFIYNIEWINGGINRLFHQLFIGSLDFAIFFLFLYVDIKARKQKRYTIKQAIIRFVPVSVALVMVIFGQLKYYIGIDGRYSYGVMAYTVYVSVAVYMFLTVLQVLKHGECFGRYEKHNILYGITLWIILAVIQFIKPTTLLSSMGMALMTLFVYISYENPREYVDYDISSVLNGHAYEVMIDEYVESRKNFAIISIALINNNLIQTTYGNQKVLDVLNGIAAYAQESFNLAAYHIDSNVIGMLISTQKKENIITDEKVKELCKVASDICELSEIRVSALKCPEYAKTTDEITRIITFVNSEREEYEKNKLVIIDEEIKGKINYEDAIERIVQTAITEDGLDVFYQPIYSTEKKKFISCEALVRLKDTTTVGFISPEIFIPIAEKKGMIDELGRVVFEKVCQFYAENGLDKLGVEYIEVNLSGKQIVDSHLPNQLLDCINKYGISSSCINLEITETAAVDAIDIMKKNMKLLQQAGFEFSMDDFGTGYSNLAGMHNMKFSLIKLDKSLIWPCFEEKDSEQAKVILEACIGMINKLKKHIVAEGVETKEQVEYLTSMGVTYLQGYYYSRPVRGEEYISFLKNNQ